MDNQTDHQTPELVSSQEQKPTRRRKSMGDLTAIVDLIGNAEAEVKSTLLKALLETAKDNPQLQAMAREAIQVAPMTQQRRRRKQLTNKDVQNFSRAYGDVTREDPDFVPVPPEHIKERGEQVVAQWQQDWLDGKNHHNAFDYDDDVIAQVHM